MPILQSSLILQRAFEFLYSFSLQYHRYPYQSITALPQFSCTSCTSSHSIFSFHPKTTFVEFRLVENELLSDYTKNEGIISILDDILALRHGNWTLKDFEKVKINQKEHWLNISHCDFILDVFISSFQCKKLLGL